MNFSLQSLINGLQNLVSSLSSYTSNLGKQPYTGLASVKPSTMSAFVAPVATGAKEAFESVKPAKEAGAITQSGLGSGSVGYKSYYDIPASERAFNPLSGLGSLQFTPATTTTTPSTTTPSSSGGGGLSSITTGGAGKDLTNAPLSSPVSSNLPPTPTGGSGFVSSVGGGGRGAPSTAVPRESVLPPTPTLPSNAIGRYEAMMRSLLQQYGNTGKVPVPLAGASSFGVGSAFGDILKQLQQRARV